MEYGTMALIFSHCYMNRTLTTNENKMSENKSVIKVDSTRKGLDNDSPRTRNSGYIIVFKGDQRLIPIQEMTTVTQV